MSVLSYIESLGSELVLSTDEKNGISTSISTLKSSLDNYFDNQINYTMTENFGFGSYDRETILPRKNDKSSDVDFMVVFENDNNYKPQTFLNKLKEFAEEKYSTSYVRQNYPTINLELNHIKFELVPAYKDYSTYYIPSKSNSLIDWMSTYPNQIKKDLIEKNKNNSYNIKPVVRLMKYWNVRKVNKGFSSFGLEEWIINQYFYDCNNLKDFLFICFENISYKYDAPQYIKDAVDYAKKIIDNVKYYESNGYPDSAENEIKKILPEI